MPKDRRITDVEGLLREARRRGAEITKTSNGHYKIVGPAGTAVVSPNWGDPRARQNSIADVRRHAGVDVTAPVDPENPDGADTSDTENPEQESPVPPTPADLAHVLRNGHPTLLPDDAPTFTSVATRDDHDTLLSMISEQGETIARLLSRIENIEDTLSRDARTVARLTARVEQLEAGATAPVAHESGWIAEMRASVCAALEPYRGGPYLPRATLAEMMGLDTTEAELKRLSYVLMMLRGEGALESTGAKAATRWRLVGDR